MSAVTTSEKTVDRPLPPRAPYILETRDLVRHFAADGSLFGDKAVVRAVDGVTLGVRRGETLSIVGESGCGKSTLARLLVRLIKPTSGGILYQGRDISALSEREMRALRRDLQFVFQDPFSSLNPRMTVGAIIEEPMRVHRIGTRAERRRRVRELLARVGLRPEFADRYPHEFSGGQRQRIGIARALASGPTVLIGDEPVSALDVSIQAQVINLLEDLKEEFDLTLILIAHDLAVIRHMSDRVAVMYLGEIVELADTDALYDRPHHPYTQALMRAIPVPSPHARDMVAELTGDVPSPLAPPSGCRFHTRCPHATELCAQKKPHLEASGDNRFVACHHWRSVADSAAGLSEEPARPANAAHRLALYRAWTKKQGQNPATQSPTDQAPTVPSEE
ncbi:oligopeptide/dipeptide ABC transporter ATP-binding protein [Breoghania corrubedonensis]|uniref:Oligopeptide/dipeptide ABC transporter ATP-binding protein n=1 Tax=Breoghania corrubedonensis TaxID=665038 RepID=A0A2T5VA21_9HYPH|nr:dipeptide ABC transporter ATP-binding protein [Breoghania corrubedonensis]PTW60600.1 oligopeptide/dipeptide ABC transporter ATP-binding protein [Breoghania corrubedonensis]